MAKYNYIKLELKNGELEGFDDLRKPEKDNLKKGDVVYIYRESGKGKLKRIYIGRTTQFVERNKQHYGGQEERFDTKGFNEVIILLSSYFNASAITDVERQLITYFIADNSIFNKQLIEYDHINEITNKTKGDRVNDYKEREAIACDVILPFWEKVLFHYGWVKTKTLDKLRNDALVKYSPLKKLTSEQSELIERITSDTHANFVINGDPGTGKTVLLTHLVASLLNVKGSNHTDMRIAVVVQPNWRDTAEKIFSVYGMNNINLTIASSTQLINADENYDIVIIDEAHKLSRNYSKQHPSFNSVYKGIFSKDKNHLESIKKIGSQIILMYDVLQHIRPANITREQFINSTKGFEKEFLTTQFRIRASKEEEYTSEDFVNGIKYLLYKDTGLLEYTNFNKNFNRAVFQNTDIDSYFGFFEEKPLKSLIDWIEEDRNFHPEHVNRIVAGLVEPWKQAHGKDSSITHWHEEQIKRRWNSTQENWVYSDEFDAEDQIGSVFAVQGIDLNKVGVLVGNDLQVDENGKLFANPNNFHNVNGKFPKHDENPENEQEFTLLVLNIYYILMTRGIDGIRLGFWRNDPFKEYLKEMLEIS